MTYDLRTSNKRSALAARREPYWTSIARGVSLGYRRGARGGTWCVRWRGADSGKRYKRLGAAEDDNRHGLTFEEAMERAVEAAMRAHQPLLEEDENTSCTAGAIDDAAVQRVVDATRSSRFQPPKIDLEVLAKDLRSVRKVHLRRAHEAPQVAADFQELANATGEVLSICSRMANDQTRNSMLLAAIKRRNNGGLVLPDFELQRLMQATRELQLLATSCADTSRVFNEISNEMGAPRHYFLLARALPRVFVKHFHQPYGRSTDMEGRRTGPGVRFVMAAAELVGIRKPDGTLYSPETLRTAEREIRKTKAPIGSE